MVSIAKKTRADGQISSLAGEFFVAAELLKRELQTSVPFGNAKAIDLLAYNPAIDRSFQIQVKALRTKNYFPISPDRVKATYIYVFVLLNKPGEAVQHFVVPGSVLVNEPERFWKDPNSTFPGVHTKCLQEFAEAWYYFDGAPAHASK